MKTKRIGFCVELDDYAKTMQGLTNLAGWLQIYGVGEKPSASALVVALGLACQDTATAEDIAQRLDRFLNHAGSTGRK